VDRLRGGGRLNAQSRSKIGWRPLGAWLGLLALLIGAGYFVFRSFAAGQIPASTQLYLLAVVAGVASFFSPCAFPLLPSYISFYYAADQRTHDGSAGRLRLGLAGALGVVTFDLVLGLIIAVFGAGLARGLSITSAEPSQFVLIVRIAIGIILLILGIGQLAGWNLKPQIADRFVYATQPKRGATRGPAASLYFYGLGYTIAGLGCTGPILAALVVAALASGGPNSALSAFLVFAATMAALMLLVSALVGGSRETIINRLKAQTPRIQRLSSYLLILVGAFNILSSFYLSQFQTLFFPT